MMRCHYCDYTVPKLYVCPICKSKNINSLDDSEINLVNFNGFQVCDIIYNDLIDMYNAAKKDGITLKINNTYRTAKDQKIVL